MNRPECGLNTNVAMTTVQGLQEEEVDVATTDLTLHVLSLGVL